MDWARIGGRSLAGNHGDVSGEWRVILWGRDGQGRGGTKLGLGFGRMSLRSGGFSLVFFLFFFYIHYTILAIFFVYTPFFIPILQNLELGR